MPDDIVHFLDHTARPFVFRGKNTGPFPANSNPSVRELLSRNGELAAQNRQLTGALAKQTSEAAHVLDRLTPRQREVMALILAGHPSKNIAADLCISQRTVETQGDLSRDEITQEIESMNDEQKDALVALFWIGRGDAEPEKWEATKALARQQHEGLVSRYLLGQPEVGEFLTEGLEKMLEYGVD